MRNAFQRNAFVICNRPTFFFLCARACEFNLMPMSQVLSAFGRKKEGKGKSTLQNGLPPVSRAMVRQDWAVSGWDA
jgi:hypothetical protein